MAEVDRYAEVIARATIHLADMVIVIDGAACFEHVNPYGLEILGYESVEAIAGQPILDHVHPDDLPRVIIGMSRMLDPSITVPGRPAQIRVRRGDGTYVRIEVNGALGALEAEPGSRSVVFARPTVEADLHEHLMALLTGGAPSEKTFELVPEFAQWRQPNLVHATFVRTDDGAPLAFGSALLTELGSLDDPDGPWRAPVETGAELFVESSELPPPARRRAEDRGITNIRARPVYDSLHRSNALVVMARDLSSPLPAERSTLEFSWFAIDKMAAVLEMALAWRAQAEELRRAASTDPLTGLANRAGFWSRYTRSVADLAVESVTVFCIDLDEFKPVNDTHGHAVGDALLTDVADRLCRVVRPGDVVARLGGDEFAIVVADLDDDAVAGIADRIVEEVRAPYAIAGRTVVVGASVGVATTGVTAFDADALLDAADRALYDAKHAGRNRWVRADHA